MLPNNPTRTLAVMDFRMFFRLSAGAPVEGVPFRTDKTGRHVVP